jgi:hypothetical protein
VDRWSDRSLEQEMNATTPIVNLVETLQMSDERIALGRA